MPLRLDVRRKLLARSDRVKSVDLHPTEPWMLASLYNGNVHIWNYETQQLVKSFEVCDLPVRCAKFVPRKNWVITGSDDMQVRVFNYNTLDKVHAFDAHSDYLRSITVHPTQPYVLTTSDDMLVKLWNWDDRGNDDKKWSLKQTFEGHTHYVMQVVLNPKDNNTFATASLDRTIKVWQLGSAQPNFTLEGHEKGVNAVDYYHGGDKPYLISGADDRLVKIWDYQNKTCVATLDGHAQNISTVCFHPELPIILTGSEDSTVRIWHANTYRLETTLNYGLERVWSIQARRGANTIAIGYDEGSVTVKLGREEPAVSMDASGKILWAKHSEIQQANLKALGDTGESNDGERLSLSVKDMGACEIYPQTIAHNPNGRFVVVCGDGEYIIYTAMALRNKAYGSALEFVWASDSNMYAVRESQTIIKVFKNFKEVRSIRPSRDAEGIFGGSMLGVRNPTALCFYDWESATLIRRIEIGAKSIFWSENGELVAITTEDSFYILKYNADVVTQAMAEGKPFGEDGLEDALEVVGEQGETVKTACWIGDCFVFTTQHNRLNYAVGGEIVTIAHLDRPMYLLGYIPKDSRLYLADKDLSVVSYQLLLPVLEYQTAVMRRDFETADQVLPTVPKDQRTRVAHFLDKQGFKKQALAVSQDPEHRFDLALQLGELETARELAAESESEEKWRLLSQVATSRSELLLAGECLSKAKDFGGMLLLASSTGNLPLMESLATNSANADQNNVSFVSNFMLGKVDACLDTLLKTERYPEAAFFARSYCPSQVSRIVALWKEKVSKTHPKIAESLADPAQYENLFPGLKEGRKAEQYINVLARNPIPAKNYPNVPANEERNISKEVEEAEASGAFRFDDSGSLLQAPSGMPVIPQPIIQSPPQAAAKQGRSSPPPRQQEPEGAEEDEADNDGGDDFYEAPESERHGAAPDVAQQAVVKPDIVQGAGNTSGKPDVTADTGQTSKQKPAVVHDNQAGPEAEDDDEDLLGGDDDDVDIEDVDDIDLDNLNLDDELDLDQD